MRYLSGMIAGAALKDQKSNRVGYIAAFPVAEVIRGINAFTMGCKSINSECEVVVMFVLTWHDSTIESAAAKKVGKVHSSAPARSRSLAFEQKLWADEGPYVLPLSIFHHQPIRSLLSARPITPITRRGLRT